MANTLAGNLQRVLREDLGGTYGVSVVPDFTKRPVEEYRVTITFACDPARTQDLVKALFTVVDDFKTRGPSAGQVADAQAALRRDLETDSRQNGSRSEPGWRLPTSTTSRCRMPRRCVRCTNR